MSGVWPVFAPAIIAHNNVRPHLYRTRLERHLQASTTAGVVVDVVDRLRARAIFLRLTMPLMTQAVGTITINGFSH